MQVTSNTPPVAFSEAHKPLTEQLYLAIKSANITEVKQVLSQGVNCNVPHNGVLPLQAILIYIADAELQQEMLTILLQAGANPKIHNTDNQTVLHAWVLTSNQHPTILTFLLTAGADLEAGDEEGVRPLHYACMLNFCKSNTVRLLLEANASVTAETQKGETALDLVRQSLLTEDDETEDGEKEKALCHSKAALLCAFGAPLPQHFNPPVIRLPDTVQPLLGHVPANLFWQLLIDGELQYIGPNVFEKNERGSLRGMFNGLQLMLDTLSEAPSPTLYHQLHDCCIDKVEKTKGDPFEKNFRDDTAVRFALKDNNSSQQGMIELIEKTRNGILKDFCDVWFINYPREINGPLINLAGWSGAASSSPTDLACAWSRRLKHYTIRYELLAHPHKRYVIVSKIDEIFSRYEAEMSTANSRDAILTAQVRCCQDLVQLHAFMDANLRTAVTLLLNKLLMYNGLSPTVLTNPSYFGGYSVAELVTLVKEGQKRFSTLIQDTQ